MLNLCDDDSYDEEKNISDNKYPECFLLILSKIIKKNSFGVSHVAIKDFNFLSKHAVFSYSHSSNVLIVSLISL